MINDVSLHDDRRSPATPTTCSEPGELIRIDVDLLGAGATIGIDLMFTLEIKPPTARIMASCSARPRPRWGRLMNLN